MDAMIGTKVGMTQVFDELGHQIPVTVIELGPCSVVQRKSVEKDGYDAVQLGYLDQKPHRLTAPIRGHFAKNKVAPKRILREVRLHHDEELGVGDTVDASIFNDIAYVDVTGISKGRGFQGVVKRHGMSGGRASHGGKSGLRTVGSIGMCEYPARVLKGKKLPGQMGNCQVTMQNLKVIEIRDEDNAVLIQGAVPGPTGGLLVVRKSKKKAGTTS